MRFLLLNGPNLDLIGVREPEIYGTRTFDDLLVELRAAYPGHVFELRSSALEGALVEALREADGTFDAVVLNAGGYSHTSVVLRDTVATIAVPVVEVHISNIHAREEFRQRSLTAAKTIGCITGFGLDGYRMAIDHLLRRSSNAS